MKNVFGKLSVLSLPSPVWLCWPGCTAAFPHEKAWLLSVAWLFWHFTLPSGSWRTCQSVWWSFEHLFTWCVLCDVFNLLHVPLLFFLSHLWKVRSTFTVLVLQDTPTQMSRAQSLEGSCLLELCHKWSSAACLTSLPHFPMWECWAVSVSLS
jgi:hypothetical protein